MEIEARAAAHLAGLGEPLVPLSALHRALARQTGPELGTALQLRERLSRRPDLFLVLERPTSTFAVEGWSEEDRVRYDALLGGAGGEAGTLVAVVAPAEAAEVRGGAVAREVGAALAELVSLSGSAPAIATALEESTPLSETLLRALTRLAP